MTTYFISDLHLHEEQPDTANLFLNFLANRALHADALYILGDFFEFWVGNDPKSEFLQKIQSALAELSSKNIPIFFMHGNRDFLIGKSFIKRTSCKLISDPHIIELYGNKWLLSHGDILMDDKRYQCYRSISRNPFIKLCFLLLPLKFRLWIANNMRKNSDANYNRLVKSNPELFDVCQKRVIKLLEKHNVTSLIHGHTHIPNIHNFKLGNADAKRIVLGSWGKQAKVLACSSNGCHLETI